MKKFYPDYTIRIKTNKYLLKKKRYYIVVVSSLYPIQTIEVLGYIYLNIYDTIKSQPIAIPTKFIYLNRLKYLYWVHIRKAKLCKSVKKLFNIFYNKDQILWQQ